jgi:hypothetical protein
MCVRDWRYWRAAINVTLARDYQSSPRSATLPRGHQYVFTVGDIAVTINLSSRCSLIAISNVGCSGRKLGPDTVGVNVELGVVDTITWS